MLQKPSRCLEGLAEVRYNHFGKYLAVSGRYRNGAKGSARDIFVKRDDQGCVEEVFGFMPEFASAIKEKELLEQELSMRELVESCPGFVAPPEGIHGRSSG